MPPIRRVAHSVRLPACRPWLRKDQRGQSLSELALILPVLLLFLLGVVNLGLTLRAQTSLTQVTQQSAQYLMNHPPATCTPNGTNDLCAEADSIIQGYLATNGFGSASALVTFSTTPQGNLLAHINVSSPFPVIIPIADALNVGPLHHSSVTIGANANTIMATPPPTNLKGAFDTGTSTFTFNWSAPVASPTSLVQFTYQIVFDDGSGNTPLPVGTPIPSTTRIATITCASLPTTDQGYCNSTLGTQMPFKVETVQNNGLVSLSSFAVGS